MKNILDDIDKMDKANELFTKALIALEDSRWDDCKKLCKDVLDTSFNIEQRLAAMLLEGLANEKNPETVKEYMNIAYSYE